MEIADKNTVHPASKTFDGAERWSFAPWEAIVEPGRVFTSPEDVLAATDLGREEKRAVLASWASDAWTVESSPALRHCPGLPGRSVTLEAVLRALRTLDPEPEEASSPSAVRGRRSVRWLTPKLPSASR